MSGNEPTLPPDDGGSGAATEPPGTARGRAERDGGTAAARLLDRYPSVRRHKWFIAGSVGSLLAIGAFVLTHGTPGALASAEMECSSYAVAQVVGDIVRKHVFAGQAGVVLDESQFGGQLLDVVTEKQTPLTCAADFKPRVAIAKGFLAQAAKGMSSSDVRGIEKEMGEKFTGRLTYTVKRTDGGDLYVEVTNGLETFDD